MHFRIRKPIFFRCFMKTSYAARALGEVAGYTCHTEFSHHGAGRCSDEVLTSNSAGHAREGENLTGSRHPDRRASSRIRSAREGERTGIRFVVSRDCDLLMEEQDAELDMSLQAFVFLIITWQRPDIGPTVVAL